MSKPGWLGHETGREVTVCTGTRGIPLEEARWFRVAGQGHGPSAGGIGTATIGERRGPSLRGGTAAQEEDGEDAPASGPALQRQGPRERAFGRHHN